MYMQHTCQQNESLTIGVTQCPRQWYGAGPQLVAAVHHPPRQHQHPCAACHTLGLQCRAVCLRHREQRQPLHRLLAVRASQPSPSEDPDTSDCTCPDAAGAVCHTSYQVWVNSGGSWDGCSCVSDGDDDSIYQTPWCCLAPTRRLSVEACCMILPSCLLLADDCDFLANPVPLSSTSGETRGIACHASSQMQLAITPCYHRACASLLVNACCCLCMAPFFLTCHFACFVTK